MSEKQWKASDTRGGNVTISPGKGYAPSGETPMDGAIIFKDADGNELLRLAKEGSFVRGVPVETPEDVFMGLRDFLRTARRCRADSDTFENLYDVGLSENETGTDHEA